MAPAPPRTGSGSAGPAGIIRSPRDRPQRHRSHPRVRSGTWWSNAPPGRRPIRTVVAASGWPRCCRRHIALRSIQRAISLTSVILSSGLDGVSTQINAARSTSLVSVMLTNEVSMPQGAKTLTQHPGGPVVAIVRRDHVVARGQGLEHRRGGSRTGGEGGSRRVSRFPALQQREALFQGTAVWIVQHGSRRSHANTRRQHPAQTWSKGR